MSQQGLQNLGEMYRYDLVGMALLLGSQDARLGWLHGRSKA
jgi:hypothetical protein